MDESRRQLKIGITCYPTVGGSGVIATELGKLLAEAGHQVHFITSSMPFRLGQYNPNIFFHEVEVNQYSVFHYPPYDLTLANKMAQVANREKLDILHVHYAIPHAICAYLAKQMTHHPLKIITTLHGTDITVLGYDQSLKDMIQFGIEKSDIVTAVSDHLIQQTYDLFDIERKIDKVYNFVDERVYSRLTNQHIHKHYSCGSEKLIIHVSNFRPVKRVMDVAQIFKMISSEISAKLILVGDGPEFPRIRQWLQEQGLDNKVIHLGEQKDVVDILSQTDLMLLPSEQESFGLVALEAMACGVPVIASNAGGLPELVVHNETGFVHPVGDVHSMAESAISLLKNDTRYQSFSERAKQLTKTRFGAQDILNDYLTLYYSVLTEDEQT